MKGNLKFTDTVKHRQFDTDGYITTPLLSQQQVENLKAEFHKHFNIEELPAVFDTIATVPSETIAVVNKAIMEICAPALQSILQNYKVTGSIFFIKKADNNSHLDLHVDPSHTTEDYNNVGVWIPLIDINEATGQICLLKGSFGFIPPYFTASMPCPYTEVEELAEPLLDRISMKAGEALFFKNNMAHCTLKNTSTTHRIAIVIKLIDENAPLVTAYYNKDEQPKPIVRLYEQGMDFFTSDNFRQPEPLPTSRFIKEIGSIPKVFTKEEFSRLITATQTL